MNSKNKNISDLYRGINTFQRSCRPRNNIVKDENGDLLADSYFSQLLNVRNIIDVPVRNIYS
jgi:hypothetical protein